MLKKATVLLALLIACRFAHADLGACFEHAAQRRHLNVNLLLAIGRVESRYRPWEVNSTSGAIGVMQILPSHLKWLARYGITREDLLDGCTNINVGAFLLADFIRMYGSTWRAVGAYGAGIAPGKEQARIAYAALVQREYERLTNPATAQAVLPVRRAPVSARPPRPTMVVDQ
ncbi:MULTISPECIES: lytic transglycosylase domain-containing protein [Burkholderiaceae]|uniref:lytic transglycosylase domain-containing protein n=1 Tax=Burkholderiaceae TaxID=119060 RepID=UPI000675D323|nr:MULTISPECIES: lytic transglycosylase domain-containing protein [Burkholderiaceae]PZR46037.1 MAG: lytic transglycosylase [Paraburkholderia fungorum]